MRSNLRSKSKWSNTKPWWAQKWSNSSKDKSSSSSQRSQLMAFLDTIWSWEMQRMKLSLLRRRCAALLCLWALNARWTFTMLRSKFHCLSKQEWRGSSLSSLVEVINTITLTRSNKSSIQVYSLLGPRTAQTPIIFLIFHLGTQSIFVK